jgi:hypothetical protein
VIYTVGHKANYLQAIADSDEGCIQKVGKTDDLNGQPYPGGYALRTYEDAQRLLEEVGHVDDWAVFGLDADWEQDTEPSQDGWWHNLLRDAWIIVLEEQS